MQILIDALGAEFRLFLWAFVGAIVGLAVELGTGDKRKSSILFQANLATGTPLLRVAISVVNIVAATLFAYVGSSLLLGRMEISKTSEHTVFFLLGVAGLSLLRAYAFATSNRKSMVDFLFKVMDLLRGGGK